MPLIKNKAASAATPKDEIAFVNLGWKILRHKCLYYELPGDTRFDYLRISDDEFDGLVRSYNKLAKKLNRKTTANMVGFDRTSGSGSLVFSKVIADAFVENGLRETTKKQKLR